ncbi:MAG: Calcium/calmodulin dependent protein kinase II association-domain protein [Parcubacteria group bacterium GW2011_GWC2_39_14]|nr:MAG: Calcium/calmodulin dependent protein kinase II association-domain protein [Parcubacteria group bacterium GW2011_GWC2_39_14]KKR55061.1 MAG: Calcium/calmodulin dependent protein kinase II association-domain protein [Parcubacteria group bacterium GW2011_GWA2_40_23]
MAQVEWEYNLIIFIFMLTSEVTNIELARENFKIWNESLLSKDAQKVAELYTVDNTFLPTMSPEFKRGQASAEGYFVHFLEKNPVGEIVEDECQVLAPDCYLHSGLYNFTVGPEDKREVVEARFSYVWKKNEAGNWKILHHHSSVKPR